jgi:hypothetical protein
MHIIMIVAMHDGARQFEVDDVLDVSPEVAADYISHGFARRVEEPTPAPARGGKAKSRG